MTMLIFRWTIPLTVLSHWQAGALYLIASQMVTIFWQQVGDLLYIHSIVERCGITNLPFVSRHLDRKGNKVFRTAPYLTQMTRVVNEVLVLIHCKGTEWFHYHIFLLIVELYKIKSMTSIVWFPNDWLLRVISHNDSQNKSQIYNFLVQISLCFVWKFYIIFI